MRVNFSIKLGMVLRYLGFHHLRNAAGNLVSAEHGEIALRKLPITSVIEMLGLVQDYQWQPPKCPVDLFLGDEDKVVASKELEQMFLPLPNVHIHWLHNSAHVLPLDNDMDEIVRCVNQETSQ
jgi:carboxylesterase